MNMKKDYTRSETKGMLKAVLYGSKKGTSYIQKFGVRFLNVLYSGADQDNEINDVASSNLKRILEKKPDKDAIINDLKKRLSVVKAKTKKHHDWAVEQNGNFKRVVFGEAAPFSGAHLLGDKPEDKKGPYYNALKKYAEKIEGKTLREQLENAETLFIDILTVPLPIDPKLRKQWSQSRAFKIGKQSLSSVLFKLALEHYKIAPKGNAKGPTIALMMPPLTADGIINDAFSQKSKSASSETIKAQLISINDPETIKEHLKKRIVPSVFSVLAMDRSNSPNGGILKKIVALELQ